MQTAALRWAGAHILGEHLTIGHVVAGNVDHGPVEHLAHLGVAAAGCIRIDHEESVQGASFGIPANGGLILHLCGRELLAEIDLSTGWVGDGNTSLWLVVDDVGNDTAGVHVALAAGYALSGVNAVTLPANDNACAIYRSRQSRRVASRNQLFIFVQFFFFFAQMRSR